jgi:hypothetical protein
MEKLDNILNEIKLIYNENSKLINELYLQENKLNNYKLNIDEINKINKDLELKVKDLEEKNNSKSSKLLWENTQKIIKEKDDEIEYLKKNILFYERQNLIKSNISSDIKNENIKNENIKNENIKNEDIKIEDIKNENIKIKKKKSKKMNKIVILQHELNTDVIDDLEKDLLSIV